MHHKLIINGKSSNMDACKMFAVLTHTTPLSLLWFSLHFNKLYGDFAMYSRPIFKLANQLTSAVAVLARVIIDCITSIFTKCCYFSKKIFYLDTWNSQ